MIVLTAEMKNPGDGAEPDPIQPAMLILTHETTMKETFRNTLIGFTCMEFGFDSNQFGKILSVQTLSTEV